MNHQNSADNYKYHYLEVVAYNGQEVVRRYDIKELSDRQIEKLDNGLNSKMNHAEYYTFIRESDFKLPVIE